MNKKGLVVSVSVSVAALALAASVSGPAIGDHGHGDGAQKLHSGELVRVVRDATRRFRNVEQAEG